MEKSEIWNVEKSKTEIAEIMHQFSRDTNVIRALTDTKGVNVESISSNSFLLKFFQNYVKEKTGTELKRYNNQFEFKNHDFYIYIRVKTLDNERGDLIIISNTIGTVYQNSNEEIFGNNCHIILHFEKGHLSKWLIVEKRPYFNIQNLYRIFEDGTEAAIAELPHADWITAYDLINEQIKNPPKYTVNKIEVEVEEYLTKFMKEFSPNEDTIIGLEETFLAKRALKKLIHKITQIYFDEDTGLTQEAIVLGINLAHNNVRKKFF